MPASRRLQYGPRASVSMPEARYAQLDMIARQRGVSISAVIRWAVEEYLDARLGAREPRQAVPA